MLFSRHGKKRQQELHVKGHVPSRERLGSQNEKGVQILRKPSLK